MQKFKVGDEVFAVEYKHSELIFKKIKVRIIESYVSDRHKEEYGSIYHGSSAIMDFDALTKEEAQQEFNEWLNNNNKE